jgi:hypothetical protein
MARRRTYPHVDQVADEQTRQALRILFDRVGEEADVADAAAVTLRDHTAQLDETTRRLTRTADIAAAALEVGGKLTSTSPDVIIGPQPPPGEGAAEASAGCANNPGTGHLGSSSGLLRADPFNLAGQIVCGTGVEWASLKVTTVDLPTREANAIELLGRMIWHLQNGSPVVQFESGRQRNPSGAISNDKLTIRIKAIWHAYDVFLAWDDFTVPLVTQMQEVFPADPIPDGGVPD